MARHSCQNQEHFRSRFVRRQGGLRDVRAERRDFSDGSETALFTPSRRTAGRRDLNVLRALEVFIESPTHRELPSVTTLGKVESVRWPTPRKKSGRAEIDLNQSKTIIASATA